MTTHSPAPGTPQTGAKAWSGALAFILASVAVRFLGQYMPDLVSDPLMVEAIQVTIAGAIGGATAYLVPNKAK